MTTMSLAYLRGHLYKEVLKVQQQKQIVLLKSRGHRKAGKLS